MNQLVVTIKYTLSPQFNVGSKHKNTITLIIRIRIFWTKYFLLEEI